MTLLETPFEPDDDLYERDVLPRIKRIRRLIREKVAGGPSLKPTKLNWLFRGLTQMHEVAAHALAVLNDIEHDTSPDDRASQIANGNKVLAAQIRIHGIEEQFVNFGLLSIREINKPITL
jgi:hypothetical protein